MQYDKTEEVQKAMNKLHDIYQREKQLRASLAWKNGVRWAIYVLQDGASLSELIQEAQDHDVKI